LSYLHEKNIIIPNSLLEWSVIWFKKNGLSQNVKVYFRNK
jgi:hypothetical protein